MGIWMHSGIHSGSWAQKKQVTPSNWTAWDSAVAWFYLTASSHDNEGRGGNGSQRRSPTEVREDYPYGGDPEPQSSQHKREPDKPISQCLSHLSVVACLCSHELNAKPGIEEAHGPSPLRPVATVRAGQSIQQRTTGVLYCIGDSLLYLCWKCTGCVRCAWKDITGSSWWPAHLPSCAEHFALCSIFSPWSSFEHRYDLFSALAFSGWHRKALSCHLGSWNDYL